MTEASRRSERTTTELHPHTVALVSHEELYGLKNQPQIEDTNPMDVDIKLVYETGAGSRKPLYERKWMIAWDIDSNSKQKIKKILSIVPSLAHASDGTKVYGMLVVSVTRPFTANERSDGWKECRLGSANLAQRKILEDIALKTAPSDDRGLMTPPQWVEAVLTKAVEKGIFQSVVFDACIRFGRNS